MKNVSFYPWFLSTLIYLVGMYFGFGDWKKYFLTYILGTSQMTDIQTRYFIALSVACLLATYNFLRYTQRYFKKVTTSKRRT